MTSQPRRILVAGRPGAGKTTLARQISAATGIRAIELDALYHGANWTQRPTFGSDVEALVASPEWVTEWQYPEVRSVLAAHAEVLVWLDLPVRLTMWRLTRRTVSRSLRRTRLWDGNTEPALRTIFTEPNHIIRWAWRTRRDLNDLVPEAARANPSLQIIHVRSKADASRLLADLTRSHPHSPSPGR